MKTPLILQGDQVVLDICDEREAQADRRLVAQWSNTLQTMLVIAALFSAVATTFLIETSKQLVGDPAETTRDILLVISQQLSNTSIPPFTNLPKKTSSTAPVSSILFMLSISWSLFGAVCAVLVFFWVIVYDQEIKGYTSQERITRRALRLDSKRGIEVLIKAVKIFLVVSQTSLFSGFMLWIGYVGEGIGRFGILSSWGLILCMLLAGCFLPNPLGPGRPPIWTTMISYFSERIRDTLQRDRGGDTLVIMRHLLWLVGSIYSIPNSRNTLLSVLRSITELPAYILPELSSWSEDTPWEPQGLFANIPEGAEITELALSCSIPRSSLYNASPVHLIPVKYLHVVLDIIAYQMGGKYRGTAIQQYMALMESLDPDETSRPYLEIFYAIIDQIITRIARVDRFSYLDGFTPIFSKFFGANWLANVMRKSSPNDIVEIFRFLAEQIFFSKSENDIIFWLNCSRVCLQILKHNTAWAFNCSRWYLATVSRGLYTLKILVRKPLIPFLCAAIDYHFYGDPRGDWTAIFVSEGRKQAAIRNKNRTLVIPGRIVLRAEIIEEMRIVRMGAHFGGLFDASSRRERDPDGICGGKIFQYDSKCGVEIMTPLADGKTVHHGGVAKGRVKSHDNYVPYTPYIIPTPFHDTILDII
ncbi:hypothetical protein CPB86DRAFT_823132 [Serendipita vermifera]|nr:hypothetical protein CPB86DRAFT_823132 [Serendipita vermifera]